MSTVATSTTAPAQKSTQATSSRVGKPPRSGVSGPADRSRARARASAWRPMRVRSTSAAPMIEPSPIRKPSRRNGSFPPSQPLLRSHGVDSQPTNPTTEAGTAMREPTMRPAPDVGHRQPARADPRHAVDQPAAERAQPGAGGKAPQRALEQRLVGERADDVRDGVARRIVELHPVDEDRRVEHPQPDAEHPHAGDEEHQLPGGGHLHPQPHRGLDEDRHGAERGDRGGHGLHVVGAVPALGAVGVGDDAAEDAGEDLPGDEDPEGEVHVRRGDTSERAKDEERHRGEHQVESERARSGHPGESNLCSVAAR